MSLDKSIIELAPLQTLTDTDLILFGRPSDGRMFQVTVAQLKAVLPSTGVNGKSAYQLAVDNGYTGTQQQWLASLKGEPGTGGGLTDGVKGDVEVKSSGTVLQTLYKPAFAGAATRSVKARLAEELWVEDFRAEGDTDDQVWDKAIAAMRQLERPLRAGRNPLDGQGFYRFYKTHFVSGAYFHLTGDNLTIINMMGNRINASTPSNYTYPSTTSLGPLVGSGFYFYEGGFNRYISGLRMIDFNFAIADLDAINGSVFNKCNFFYCCCGVFCYQSMQNYQFVNCEIAATGALIMGCCTAFPTGTPWYNKDNYFFDGLAIKNEGNGYGVLSATVYADFDRYVRESILRPETGSTVFERQTDYLYPVGLTHEYCQPTGRIVWAPMRNQRSIYGPRFINLDLRGNTPRGFALLNAGVWGLNIIGDWVIEGAFQSASRPDLQGFFTVGSIQGGYCDIRHITVEGHDLFHYTFRGYDRPYQEVWNKLNIQYPNYTGIQYLDNAIRNIGTRSYITGRIGIITSDKFAFSLLDYSIDARQISNLKNCTLYLYGPEGQTQSMALTGAGVQASDPHDLYIYSTAINAVMLDKGLGVIIFGDGSQSIATQQALGFVPQLGETSTTPYRGDRGKIAYDHSQLTSGNPHNVTAEQVGAYTKAEMNTALSNKQAKLVSGMSIKTYGGQTLLGEGDIPVPAAGIDKNLVMVSNNNAQTFVSSTFTTIQYPTVLLNSNNCFDPATGEYVVPATGIYVSTLRLSLPNNAASSKSYGIGVGLNTISAIGAATPDSHISWKNTERTASQNRNTALDVTYLSLTAGQRIKTFCYMDSFDTTALVDWTVHRFQ